MEEQRECDKIENHVHCFYFVKVRPSREGIEKEEAGKQYTLARSRIKEAIAKQKAVEHQINEKITWFVGLDERIKQAMEYIKYLERWERHTVNNYTPINSVQITNGFFRLYGKDVWGKDVQTHVRPDRKRCQKKLIKKGVMDVEYLEQVQEELMTSKKSSGITSCGTRELNHLVESITHRIQHGNEKRAHEMKIYHEIKTVNETRELYTAPSPLNPYRNIYLRLKDGDLKGEKDWKLSKQHKINIGLDKLEKLKRYLIGRNNEVTRLKANLELVRKSITCLNKELENVTSKRTEAYKRANKLGDQSIEMKSYYVEYQSIMTNAEELARRGDIVGLKRLRNTQVVGFRRQWCESKGFRDDYETRKLASKRL